MRPTLPQNHIASAFDRAAPCGPARAADDLYDICPVDGRAEYDVRDVLRCILDDGPFDEYKAKYGKTLVTGTGRLGGFAVAVVASQRTQQRPTRGPIHALLDIPFRLRDHPGSLDL